MGTDPEAASKFATETWKVSSDAAKAKAEEEATKAAEEAKKRRIEDGGFMVQLELLYEYAAENPAISIPVVLVVVFLLLKFLFGGKKPQPIPEDKEEEKEEEKEEKEGAKEAEAPARNLRKRAPKGKDSEQKVATKE